VTDSFTVNPIQQTITFPDMAALTVGDTGQAAATSDSGLGISYSSQTTDVCTVDADTGLVTTLTVGTCTIAADQDGNDTYAPAEQVTSTFAVNAVPPSAQTISANDQGTVNVSVEQVTLSASADSGLPVTFTSGTTGVCTVDSSTGVVTLLAAGTCTITVSQDGDDAYLAATPVDVTFTVDSAVQALTFTPPTRLLTGPDAYGLTATSSAFLPVSFAVTAGDDVCSLSGAELTVTGTGTCDVEASAAGNDVYAAALPVTHTIQVVAPSDDFVTLPPTTGQLASRQIAVLSNDPSGLTLADLGLAAHGTAIVDNDEVTYTPDVMFRGVDEFTYTVSDGAGRTASALVTVTVADAAPTATGAVLRQVAGTVRHVSIDAADLNGDPLSLTVVRNPASVPVTINGLTVRLAPPATLTGRVTITLAVHDGAGRTTHVKVVDTIRPQRVSWARRTISRTGTHINWSRAAAADATYRVRIGRHLACVTSALSCDTRRLLGPAARVWVRVVGHDGTRSARTAAKPVHKAQVLVRVVYFASGSWTLNDAQRAQLGLLAHRLTRDGFRNVRLNGYTDSIGSIKYNLHLSHQRTATIARLLRNAGGIASRQAWFGKANPAVPGRSAAKNRRVEILVS
jgi:outer membrane protein OmpA-like peptidoglycan-associated protein